VKKKTKKSEPLRLPFVIVADGREGAAYHFQGIRGDYRDDYRPLIVDWEWGFLKTGDYSLKGFEARCAVERKSLVDLYGTLGQHRKRFLREHERLAAMDYKAVVVEASLADVIRRPPPRSKLNPKTVYRTVLAWSVELGVSWIFAEDRRLGEVTTFRLLRRWHEKFMKEVEDDLRLRTQTA
jgi:DNA excision repair protein ERCC-4